MKTLPLKVFDETLRDGEQQAGLFFRYEEKKTLAHLIAATGVHRIDVMPVIDDSEEHLLKALVADGLGALLAPATMMGKAFIDHAKSCGVERIILFHAVSDRLLFLRDPEIRRSLVFQDKTIDDDIPEAVINGVRENMVYKVLQNLQYATSAAVGLKVDFAAEDASRANFEFLGHCIGEFRPFVENFMLCDTVGVLSPDKAFNWVSQLLKITNHAPLAVHFHNDLGLALENTIQAVLAGASMISGTFTGIGERAGNVALEQVLNGLKVRFGIEVEGINYEAVERVASHLTSLGIRPALPYSKAAQTHETGIHVNSILQDRKSYSIFEYEELEIWFGKYSGSSNFQYLFENCLDRPLSKERYSHMRGVIKSLSLKHQRCFSPHEVIAFFEDGIFDV
jgi:benzylmalate synthase